MAESRRVPHLSVDERRAQGKEAQPHTSVQFLVPGRRMRLGAWHCELRLRESRETEGWRRTSGSERLVSRSPLTLGGGGVSSPVLRLG